MTGFAKTRNNPTRTEIQIKAGHESTKGRVTKNPVCFHQHHFCDLVSSWWSTMECVVPLRRTPCTNKATLGVKLLSATI